MTTAIIQAKIDRVKAQIEKLKREQAVRGYAQSRIEKKVLARQRFIAGEWFLEKATESELNLMLSELPAHERILFNALVANETRKNAIIPLSNKPEFPYEI